MESCDSSQSPLSAPPLSTNAQTQGSVDWPAIPQNLCCHHSHLGAFRARPLGSYHMMGTTFDPGDMVVSRTAMASRAQLGEGHRQRSNDSMTTVKSELCHASCWAWLGSVMRIPEKGV